MSEDSYSAHTNKMNTSKTKEEEAFGAVWRQRQTDLCWVLSGPEINFKDMEGYPEKLCLKKQTNKQTNKQTENLLKMEMQARPDGRDHWFPALERQKGTICVYSSLLPNKYQQLHFLLLKTLLTQEVCGASCGLSDWFLVGLTKMPRGLAHLWGTFLDWIL